MVKITVCIPERKITDEYEIKFNGLYMNYGAKKLKVPKLFVVIKHIFLKRGIYKKRLISLQLL